MRRWEQGMKPHARTTSNVLPSSSTIMFTSCHKCLTSDQNPWLSLQAIGLGPRMQRPHPIPGGIESQVAEVKHSVEVSVMSLDGRVRTPKRGKGSLMVFWALDNDVRRHSVAYYGVVNTSRKMIVRQDVTGYAVSRQYASESFVPYATPYVAVSTAVSEHKERLWFSQNRNGKVRGILLFFHRRDNKIFTINWLLLATDI